MKKMLMGACMVLATCLLVQPGVQARESASKTAKASKTRKVKAPKPPVQSGPGESRAERDKRLLRECRGKPNAGACEGYAH